VYQEDFNNERKDRESAHAQKNALEERFAADVAKLKEQLQRVSADNGRLAKTMKEKERQLQRQIQERTQHIDTLKANENVLQVHIQCTCTLQKVDVH
jgi:septal ring factor EnvC (AmiA/AmiB activator)